MRELENRSSKLYFRCIPSKRLRDISEKVKLLNLKRGSTLQVLDVSMIRCSSHELWVAQWNQKFTMATFVYSERSQKERVKERSCSFSTARFLIPKLAAPIR